jgi:cysteine-rich repeat protein
LLLATACPETPPPGDDGGAPEEDAGNQNPPQDAGNPPPDGGAPPANCGDGVVDGDEECDDENLVQTDGCLNNCKYNICGDGYVYEGTEECDVGDTEPGDGCSPVCLNEEPPPPDYVEVSGIVQDREYGNAANYPLNYVEVQARNVQCDDGNGAGDCTKSTTDNTGAYAINYVPPASTFYFDTRFVPYAGNEALYGAAGALYDERYQPGGYATRVSAASEAAATTVNTYMVKHSWLEEVAVACGLYDAGLYDAQANPTYVQNHPDWSTYSAFVGFLKDGNGAGVAGVPKARIQVELGGYLNNNEAYVCFLNDDGNGKYIGTQNATSYANGGYVYFKARNNDGFGVGNAYMRVTYDAVAANFAEQSVPVQAGQVGLATLYTADDVPPVVDLINFDLDIYPMFNQYGCTNCHGENAPAAGLSFYGDPEAVYQGIYNGNTTCPDGGPYYRACVNNPEYSLLLSKPLLEDPPNHPNASFADKYNADYIKIRAWIEQGAARVPPVVPPEDQVYTLTGVMYVSQQRGCTSCHTDPDPADPAVRPSGNLDLYGCEDYYIDNGAYTAAGIDYDPVTNPDYYKRDCVYYHLKKQLVDDDYYYAEQPDNDENNVAGEVTDGRRVNIDYPAHSMLVRNPYCGPTYCEDDDDYASAAHPVKVFANDVDPGYTAFYSWVGAGALQDGDADTYYYYVTP